MMSFDEIRRECERNSRLAAKIVDGFLVGYAARQQGLEKKMEQKFARFRHVTRKFDKGTVNLMKSQYIVHRIFMEGGMIEKLMNHPVLNRFKGEEREYLERQASMPWRFSFSEIKGEPEEDFFLMVDVLTEAEYLLFSPGTSQLKDSGNPILWLNLIGFNGECWQSFGPIGAFNSFQPDDIFFYASELDPDIGDEADMARHIEANPVPYMMLLSGAAYPLSFLKNEQMGYMVAEYDLESLDTAALRKRFKTEYSNGVYRLILREQGNSPQPGEAYFDENLKIILFNAMTVSGFRKLVKGVNQFGFHFSEDPVLRVNPSMMVTAREILQREVVLNEYAELFHFEPDEKEKRVTDTINAFIALVLPDINAGRTPDIEAAVRETGIAMETALDLVKMITEKKGGQAPSVS